jgi:hypothetical protein
MESFDLGAPCKADAELRGEAEMTIAWAGKQQQFYESPVERMTC